MKQFDIGIVGLAVMGRSLALNIADHGYEVACYNRSEQVTKTMVERYPHEHMTAFYDLKELVAALQKPRKIMLMVQAGKPVDAVVEQLVTLLEVGDIILDGGNSFFEDTIRREAYLKEKGIHYFGVGVSGGEEGARFGPSIMPSGDPSSYEEIRPILESIAAKASDGSTCCTYIGSDGAGHYVKMVHNGIEYADMQLIAEAYILLKELGNFSNDEIAETFHQWNQGELSSFLIRITADIFKEQEEDGYLIDHIVDSAGQKGTGRWASIESLKEGVDISMITASCNARVMSNHLASRSRAATMIPVAKLYQVEDKQAFAETVRQALYAGKIIAYAQGFDLLHKASQRYGWNLPLAHIAGIFRAGCIIQADFLNDIMEAYQTEELDNLLFAHVFTERINTHQQSLRDVVSMAVQHGIPLPSMSNALAYLDMFRAEHVGANLIQAQRDYFGAHTYQHIHKEGAFHHEWKRHYEE